MKPKAAHALVIVLMTVSATVYPHAARSVSQTSGRYFRFKANLEYDGKPFVFDIVVGCNVKVTRYSFGGSSHDTMAVSATSFAQATPDGHVIAVQTLPVGPYHFCDGDSSENGRVPADYMPLVGWFERADLLGQGVAYRTPAAYAHSTSRLKFRSSSVHPATREDFDAFQATGPKNLFPPHQVNWLSSGLVTLLPNGDLPQEYVDDPRRAWKLLKARGCYGVARTRLSPAARERVRKYWPEDRPHFWQPSDRWDWLELEGSSPEIRRPFNETSYSPSTYYSADVEVYPAKVSYLLSQLNPNTFSDGKYYYDITIDDALSGLLTCDQRPTFDLEEAVTHRKVSDKNRFQQIVTRVNGSTVPHGPPGGLGGIYRVFERDEYVISSLQTIGF